MSFYNNFDSIMTILKSFKRSSMIDKS